PGLPGYSKRQPITINSASALTDYQVKLTITYDSDMQPDFDDLRFTSADGTTELSYWLESKTDSTTAIVWVKVPSLASGDNTLYMYYANASATTASNGDNTFVFFDDFLGSSLDTNKWSNSLIPYNGGIGTIGVSNSQLTLTQTRAASSGVSMRSVSELASDTYTIRYKCDARLSNGPYAQMRVVLHDSTTADPGGWGSFFSQDGNAVVFNSLFTAETYITSTPAIWEQQGRVTNPILKKDGVIKLTYLGTPSAPAGKYIRIWAYYTNTAEKIDWILVRQYVATEPISSFGAEQSI
ncbi:MAG: DUF2341 domain-containing protein, partial [Candidatus Paceibacterota bacterium]